MITAPVRQGDRLAALQAPAVGPRRDAECVGRGNVEAAGPFLLDERVAEGRHAVLDVERDDAVFAAVEHVVGLQLDELEGIGEPPEDPAQRAEQVGEPARTVDGDRLLAPAQREGLQHPGQAEVVIRVEVREEDLGQLREPDVGAHQLPLRPLAAVDQQPVAPTPDEQRRSRPPSRRHRPRGPEEDNVQVHEAHCAAQPQKARLSRADTKPLRSRAHPPAAVKWARAQSAPAQVFPPEMLAFRAKRAARSAAKR